MRRVPPLLSLALGFGGCVDVSHWGARSVAPTFAREESARQARERARRDAMVTISFERTSPVHRVLTEGDVTHVLAGSLRVDVRGGAASAGVEYTPSVIQGAMKSARNWLFTTRDAVYASDSFTGPLRLLRAFPDPSRTEPDSNVWMHRSFQRLALTVGNRETFVFDGVELRRLDLPPALSVAWSGPRVGAALLVDLRLRATTDGGASWRDVDLRGELPLRVEGEREGVFLVTDLGRRRIDGVDLVPVTDPTPSRHRDDADYLARCSIPQIESEDFSRIRTLRYERAAGPDSGSSPRPRPDLAGRSGTQLVRTPMALRLPPRVFDHNDGSRFTFPGAVPRALGTLEQRVFAENGSTDVMLSGRLVGAVSDRQQAVLTWRGADDRGPFERRLQVAAPPRLEEGERWLLLAATRTGALFCLRQVSEGVAGDLAHNPPGRLFWFNSTGASAVPIFRDLDLTPIGATALEDGSVIALVHSSVSDTRCDRAYEAGGASITTAVHLGPDGTLIGKVSAATSPWLRIAVGLGRLNGSWGLLLAERTSPSETRWIPFRGPERPFAGLSPDATPRVCGLASLSAQVVVEFGSSSRWPDERGGALVSLNEGLSVTSARFERDEQGVCVRQVTAFAQGESLYDDSENGNRLSNLMRLSAHNGSLVGTYDNGRSIAPISATFGVWASGDPDH